jgi:hypothetical protein
MIWLNAPFGLSPKYISAMPHARLLYGLRAEPLGPGWVDQAWFLVRTGLPIIDQAQWRRFGSRRAAEGALLGALSADGLLHGIAAWTIEEGLFGRALKVDLFITLEMLACAPARTALAEELERIARDRQCRMLDLMASPRADEGGWAVLGYQPAARALRRPLYPDTAGRPS